MQVIVAAIGKQRGDAAESLLVADYLERAKSMGRQYGFSDFRLSQSEAPRSLSGKARQAREGEMLLSAVPEKADIVVLDERGENISSEKLSAYLGRRRDDGCAAAAFLIGGADGHGANVKSRAVKTISFGAATWPHMLVRAMLAEQLYRTVTILARHPYHRS